MVMADVIISLGTLVAIYGLLALGLNVKYGYTGLLDLGHVAFYLIGAYLTALLVLPPSENTQFASYVLGLNWPWLPAIAVATVAAGVGGLIVALPAIRLQEDYLAITALGISVILKRTVQTEGWIANGPDVLRGFTPPLAGHLPLPGRSLTGALLLGGVVFVLWTTATYLLGTVLYRRQVPDGASRFVRWSLALSTLGIGYWGAGRAFGSGSDDLRYVGAVGLVAATVAVGGVLAGLGSVTTFGFLGLMSLFTWLLGGVWVVQHYEALAPRESATSLVLAVVFLLTLLPLVLLGGGENELLSTVGILVTLVLVSGFVYLTYYLSGNEVVVRSDTTFLSIIGQGAIWLFVLRYFVLDSIQPLLQGGPAGLVANTVANLFWLVEFAPAGPELNYSRFLFVGTVGVLGFAYYLVEVVTSSPFGRVLRAIREDEDVTLALGKNTFVYKIQSMVIGSALAGVAGGLSTIYFGSLTHTMFAPSVTFIVLLMVIIGGTGNNRGAVLGAVIFWGFQTATEDIAAFFPTAARSSIQALRLAFIGVLLVLILYYRPGGLWQEPKTTVHGVNDD